MHFVAGRVLMDRGRQSGKQFPVKLFDDPSLGSQLRSITSRINLILQGNNNVHMIRDCIQQVNSVINSMQRVTPAKLKGVIHVRGESFIPRQKCSANH